MIEGKSDRKIKSKEEIKRQSGGGKARWNTFGGWGGEQIVREGVKRRERECKHPFASVLVSARFHSEHLCV